MKGPAGMDLLLEEKEDGDGRRTPSAHSQTNKFSMYLVDPVRRQPHHEEEDQHGQQEEQHQELHVDERQGHDAETEEQHQHAQPKMIDEPAVTSQKEDSGAFNQLHDEAYKQADLQEDLHEKKEIEDVDGDEGIFVNAIECFEEDGEGDDAISSQDVNITADKASRLAAFNWWLKSYQYQWANVVVIWTLAFLLHFHTIFGSFVWDDRAAVINNKDVNGGSAHWTLIFTNDFWGAPLTLPNSHKSYRPLTTLSYRLNFMIHDFHPRGYHVANVILHATVCALVLLTARSMLKREQPSLAAALLFLAHPMHVESICPIVGRADCLCGVFYLAALLVYRRSTQTTEPEATRSSSSMIKSVFGVLLAYIFGLGAFLSKEVGVTVFGLFVVQDLYPMDDDGDRTALGFIVASLARLKKPLVMLRLGLCMACLAGLLYLRLLLHGERIIMHWSILENEIAHMDSRIGRGFAIAHVHFIYVWKLLFPFRQSYDYGFACINHVTSLFDWRNLLVVSNYGVIVAIIILGFQRRASSLIWPMALLLVSFSPAAHVLFFVGAVVAERLLYLPSAGFCMLVAALLDMWVRGELNLSKEQTGSSKEGGKSQGDREEGEKDRHERSESNRLRSCMIGLGVWVTILAGRSAHHAWIWRSEEPVFINAMRTCPLSAKVLNNHALSMLNVTHAGEAEKELSVAIDVFPEYSNAHYNKALCHFLLGEHDLAVKHFGIALRSDTCNLQAYSYLGQSEMMMYERLRHSYDGGDEEEVEAAESSSSCTNETATISAAEKLRMSKESLAIRAAAHLDHAISHGLESPTTFHYRGSLALALDKPQLAAYFLEKALQFHERAVEEKQLVRSKVVRQYSDDLNVAFTRNQLGLAYKAMGMPQEAEQEFLRGLQYEPNSYELLANLGTIFLENNELDLALVWLQKALDLNPSSQDLLNNMGVVEEKRGAYHKARKYFIRASEQPPVGNPTVFNNIKRVEQALQGLE